MSEPTIDLAAIKARAIPRYKPHRLTMKAPEVLALVAVAEAAHAHMDWLFKERPKEPVDGTEFLLRDALAKFSFDDDRETWGQFDPEHLRKLLKDNS